MNLDMTQPASPRAGNQSDREPTLLFLLNCYDVWSATPTVADTCGSTDRPQTLNL